MPAGVNNNPVQPGDGKPLPGPFRLEAARYKGIFDENMTVYGRTLVMWVAYRKDSGRKAGIVVAKRTIRRAVDRNRAKRLLREAFRLSRHRLASDVEVILIARAGIAGKSCQEVMDDLVTVYRRARVRRSDREAFLMTPR